MVYAATLARLLACALWLTLPLSAFATPDAKAPDSSPQSAATSAYLHPASNRWIGGRLSEAELPRLDAMGIRHVISMAPDSETPELDEAALLAGFGIRQHTLPVSEPSHLTRLNAERLDTLLAAVGEDNTLLHCASGNRVGALIAVRAAWMEGLDTEAALAKGKAWGLTRWEPEVRALLATEAITTAQ